MKTWPVIVLATSLALSALIASSAYRFSALHGNDLATPTITVSGEGEATALPDIATVTFTINQVSVNVKDAQKKVENTMSTVSIALNALGVSGKDVKTETYSVSPKYSYPQIICMSSSCPASSPKLEGYEVSETVSVKVRKIDVAGDVLALLGKNEVKDISGPQFSVENNEALLKTARTQAIEKAEVKAKETAKSLGVSLGEIKSYNEGGSTPYLPMYTKTMSLDAFAGGVEKVTLAPGESKVKVSVSIVYTLK